jgi:uncharacterized integral membrane protein
MLVFGILVTLAVAGAGGAFGWENRDVTVRVHLAGQIWTSPLWSVLVLGAVLTGWLFFGLSCIQLRIRERRERASVAEGTVPPAAQRSASRRRTRRQVRVV